MDLAMMFITFTLSVIWNVEIGIVVSLIIALLLVVRRSSKTRMTVLVSPAKPHCLNVLTDDLTTGPCSRHKSVAICDRRPRGRRYSWDIDRAYSRES